MSTLTRRQRADPPARRGAARQNVVALWAVTVEATAFAVLVGVGGSPGWRAARVATVLLVGAGALAAERAAGGPGVRGGVALLLGLVGLTAGIGIGAMHVVRSDATVNAVAALVALASGLLLLGIGISRFWRATPRWWRLLGLPLAFLCLEFAVIPATVAVYATNLPATRLDRTTPADRGLGYLDVTIRDGPVRLSAWYLPSANGAAIVVLHGSGSTRSAVLDEAVVLARNGYGVLLLDARGHGRSGGIGMDFGWWGDRDIATAVRWLHSRPDVRDGRIGALGMSMGGEEAIGAAARNTAIRAVVAEGALWRGSMDAGWLPHTLSGYTRRGMLAVQTAVTALLTDAPQPISLRRAVVSMAPRHLLLIAGEPEIRGDRYLRDAAPGTVELWELADTPHVAGLSRHPAEWESRVIGFLDRNLLPAHR